MAKMLKAEDILNMKQEELSAELEKFGQDVKGLTKLQMQKALLKLVKSPNSSPKAKESGVQAENSKIEIGERTGRNCTYTAKRRPRSGKTV